MKRLLTLLTAGLLIGAIFSQALAWEFSLTGEMEARYRYISRTGDNDLFGAANTAATGYNDGAIGLAGYYGGANQVVAQGYSAKGSDAAYNDYRIWLYPEIRINRAVRLRGEYWVTGGNIRGSFDGLGGGATGGDAFYLNRGGQGWYIGPCPATRVGMSTGMWENFWVTAQTPWGILALGRRPAPFGLGWRNQPDAEFVTLAVPYGPLRVLMSWQLYDNNWIAPNQAQQLATTTNGGFNPAAVAAPTDKNGMRNLNGALAITYQSGEIDLGTASRFLFYNDTHSYSSSASGVAPVPAGPNRRDDASNDPVTSPFAGTTLNGLPTCSDVNLWQQTYYMKYCNGRGFLNAEYVMTIYEVFRKGGRPISGWQDAWMLEFGAIVGPAKLTLAGFYKSGHDRRGGMLNTASPTGSVSGTFVADRFDQFVTFATGSNVAAQPYNYLIGLYGGGNNGYDVRGLPVYTDFLAYAARLDYAVAANLNAFGSFMYANRASKTATAIGQYRGGVSNATYRVHPGFNSSGTQNAAVPNVPDNYLGWEADIGIDWKLLEGLTFHALFAYWQPGDWFKWAYVDYTGPTVTRVGGVDYPVNPNRSIDPLIGFQGSMVVSF